MTLDLIHAQTWPAHRERADFRNLERERADMELRRVICARCGKRSRLMDGPCGRARFAAHYCTGRDA